MKAPTRIRISIGLPAALWLLGIGSAPALVTNGGYESAGTTAEDATAWTEAAGISSRSNERARSGLWSVKSVGSPANGFPATNQTITVGGLEGRTYVAGLWALTPSSNPITSGGARLKLIFRDASNATIAQVDPLFFTPAAGSDVWKKGVVTGTIPAGAASVVFQAMHDVGSNAGSELFLDDATFQVLDGNLPTDGSFEVGGSAGDDDAFMWSEQGGGIQVRSNDTARTGTWSLKSSSAVTNSFPNTFQNVNVSALNGRGVVATLWALSPSANPILSGGARIKAEFFKGGTSLGSAETSNFLGSASPKDTWIQGRLEVVVPPGATTMKLQAMHSIGGTGGGLLYFDDFLLGFSAPGLPANPGFETEGSGPADATFWGETSVAGRSNENARSGSWSLKSVGSPANGFPASTQEFLVTGVTGQAFTAKIWAMTPSANPIASGGARIKIVFRNSANLDIASFDPVFLNTSTPHDTWVEGTVTGTIPANAVRARFQAMHDVGAITGRTIHFDDASFTITPNDIFAGWAAANGLVSGQNGPNDDPDDDGATNLLEFGVDGNPRSGSDSGGVFLSRWDSNSNGRDDLTLVVATRAGATFTAGPNGTQIATIDGIAYTIEGSLDLVNFTSAVSHVMTSTSPNPDYEYQTFRLNASDTESPSEAGFLRVRVTRP